MSEGKIRRRRSRSTVQDGSLVPHQLKTCLAMSAEQVVDAILAG